MSSDKKPGYNTYQPGTGDGFERNWKPSYVSGLTLKALEELEFVKNLAEFIAICDEQKRKRGW